MFFTVCVANVGPRRVLIHPICVLHVCELKSTSQKASPSKYTWTFVNLVKGMFYSWIEVTNLKALYFNWLNGTYLLLIIKINYMNNYNIYTCTLCYKICSYKRLLKFILKTIKTDDVSTLTERHQFKVSWIIVKIRIWDMFM